MQLDINLQFVNIHNLDLDWSELLNKATICNIRLDGSAIKSLKGCPDCKLLSITNCVNLKSLKHCPHVEYLYIDNRMEQYLIYVPNLHKCNVFINNAKCVVSVEAIQRRRILHGLRIVQRIYLTFLSNMIKKRWTRYWWYNKVLVMIDGVPIEMNRFTAKLMFLKQIGIA